MQVIDEHATQERPRGGVFQLMSSCRRTVDIRPSAPTINRQDTSWITSSCS
jgi:hypothetical protein